MCGVVFGRRGPRTEHSSAPRAPFGLSRCPVLLPCKAYFTSPLGVLASKRTRFVWCPTLRDAYLGFHVFWLGALALTARPRLLQSEPARSSLESRTVGRSRQFRNRKSASKTGCEGVGGEGSPVADVTTTRAGVKEARPRVLRGKSLGKQRWGVEHFLFLRRNVDSSSSVSSQLPGALRRALPSARVLRRGSWTERERGYACVLLRRDPDEVSGQWCVVYVVRRAVSIFDRGQ